MKKRIKIIKNALIRLLGGYTEQHMLDLMQEVAYTSVEDARLKAIDLCLDHADSLYGTDAEEWSKEMYKYMHKLLINFPRPEILIECDDDIINLNITYNDETQS